eukprot:TRINITY_DN4705_c0_g1_i1.p1 TRINITY_DN4705_c0_g1~~TRINITY_DN4705_c0_g1_i1.p1  ORF type:complete len:183 (+),score=36.66 TRINITY_DN4705_c0_g1_i1:30-551(+)
MSAVVSHSWLAQSLRNASASLKVVDASWYLPSQNRNARAEYNRKRIRTASFFDLDEVCDHASPHPHMLPSPAQFESAMIGLGISNSDHVVVYDGAGLFSAARYWWMMKYFGHDACSVLDGGLPLFEQHNADLIDKAPPKEPEASENVFPCNGDFKYVLVHGCRSAHLDMKSLC